MPSPDYVKCTTCPVTLPACGGQLNGAICNPNNASPMDDTGAPIVAADDSSTAAITAVRNERGKTASSIYYGWPSP